VANVPKNNKETHVLAFFPAWWCDSKPSVNVCNWPILILDKFFSQPNHLTWAKSFVMCTIFPGHEDEPLVGPHTKSPSLNSCFGWSESFAISLSASTEATNNPRSKVRYLPNILQSEKRRNGLRMNKLCTRCDDFPVSLFLVIQSSTHQVNMDLFIWFSGKLATP